MIDLQGQTFKNIDFSLEGFKSGEYDKCLFTQCNLSEQDLTDSNFSDCEFRSCNLSMVNLHGVALRNIKFSDCKLLGVHFEHCNEFLFEVGFENCQLDLSSFYKLGLKKTIFRNCSLHEVDFTLCDLNQAVFDECSLMGATFDNTKLESCDFRTAVHYAINPEINKIKKAKFSVQGLPGLLYQYGIEVE